MRNVQPGHCVAQGGVYQREGDIRGMKREKVLESGGGGRDLPQ